MRVSLFAISGRHDVFQNNNEWNLTWEAMNISRPIEIYEKRISKGLIWSNELSDAFWIQSICVHSSVTFWYAPIFQYTQGAYTNGISISCMHPRLRSTLLSMYYTTQVASRMGQVFTFTGWGWNIAQVGMLHQTSNCLTTWLSTGRSN